MALPLARQHVCSPKASGHRPGAGTYHFLRSRFYPPGTKGKSDGALTTEDSSIDPSAPGGLIETEPDPSTRGDRFGLTFGSIVLTILVTALAGDEAWGRFISVALLGVTLLLVLRTTQARRRARLLAAVLVTAATLATAASVVLDNEGFSEWAVPVVGACLALGAPVAIARRLITHRRVTFETVLGALCLYLLAAMFFAFLYSAVAALSGEPFFLGEPSGGNSDYVYFSFSTITTTGYGDLSAASDLGRMLSVTEALIGQLYLVTVVAVLVSNLGRPRRLRGD
jgi:Ion channel